MSDDVIGAAIDAGYVASNSSPRGVQAYRADIAVILVAAVPLILEALAEKIEIGTAGFYSTGSRGSALLGEIVALVRAEAARWSA